MFDLWRRWRRIRQQLNAAPWTALRLARAYPGGRKPSQVQQLANVAASTTTGPLRGDLSGAKRRVDETAAGGRFIERPEPGTRATLQARVACLDNIDITPKARKQCIAAAKLLNKHGLLCQPES